MIVKDWFEGVIHDYDEISAKNPNTEQQNTNVDAPPESNES